MHLLIIILLLTVSSPAFAAVFKQVDKDGNVTYSDVPSKATEKPVKVAPVSTIKSPPVKSSTRTEDPSKQPDTQYRSLTIMKPANDDVIRANGGEINVSILSQPALETSRGHQYVILLDGAVAVTGQSTNINLSGVARGKHTLSAQIQDKDHKVIATSQGISIQVLRASTLSPARARP